MTAPGDLDALITRLRGAAEALDGDAPPIAPPIGAWHARLAELRDRLEAPYPLLDPAAPRLAELLALDRDDDAFLAGLYRHLLGRDIDPEGREHYRAQCQAQGRLAVAVALSQAEEATQHAREQGLVLPPGLVRCRRWQRRMARLGPLRGQGERLWRAMLRRVERWRGPRWALDAALCRQLVHQRHWPEERHQLASAVLEMDERQRHFGHRQDHEYARQQALWQRFAAWRRAGAPAASPAQAADTDTYRAAAAAAQPLAAAPAELDAYYLAFEAAFRGPEADIAAHLDHYRDAWTQARQAGAHALDLGCGRGEWLRLLAQAGFTPRGIDLNATMVAHCREQGFDVTQQDALAALGECADDSLALISGFHIAEHLPFEALFALVGEAHRALAPGGVLILETPNPENLIVASYSFYHDLTHRNPLTPPTLQFLLQFHGFGDAAIRRFNPPPAETRVPGEGPAVERLNALLAAPMDYAVVGRKAPNDEGAA
ncbi:class I SAM-dependent methyltransferase [Halomonas sp.]|uniref:class I SAM-dependent methyltransferase n=1 Tax=Halomonas sp. TaxID=1486246 RepID=UPI003D122F50